MTISILTLIYIVCNMIAIGAGAAVLFGLITGELLDDYALLFLRFALATSVTGLLFPSDRLLPSQKICMLSIYGSGLAVIAWRKFQLARVWRSVFALNITMVLYMSLLVAVAQLFEYIPVFNALPPTPSRRASLVARLLVTAIFVMLGIRAVKGFRHDSTHSSLTFRKSARSGAFLRPATPQTPKNNDPGRPVRRVPGRPDGAENHRRY